jgi:hypothetical protein
VKETKSTTQMSMRSSRTHDTRLAVCLTWTNGRRIAPMGENTNLVRNRRIGTRQLVTL